MSGHESLRILMLTSEATWRGGEAQIDLLMRGMRERGHRVSLAAPPGSGIAGRTAPGIPHFPLPISGGLDLPAAYRLRAILGRERFDILHSHSSHAHGAAFLAALGLRRRPRLVVSRRVAFPVSSNPLSRLKYARGADRYLAISTAVRDELIAGGVAADKIDIVPSGVDLAKFAEYAPDADLLRELAIPAGVPVVATIGALVPNKAQADFIRAAESILQKIPSAQFLIVGEGPERRRLHALARELRIHDRIHFAGFREDALALMSLCDCFVISSILEGLCTSIMDAHLAGVPVVATGTGGIPDLVTDGETGLLVAPRRPAQLGAAIARMLVDSDLRSRCITGGKEKAAAYDSRVMVARTEATYRAVLER